MRCTGNLMRRRAGLRPATAGVPDQAGNNPNPFGASPATGRLRPTSRSNWAAVSEAVADVRRVLDAMRRDGQPFDRAWPIAREKAPDGWAPVLDACRPAWFRAYIGRPATDPETALVTALSSHYDLRWGHGPMRVLRVTGPARSGRAVLPAGLRGRRRARSGRRAPMVERHYGTLLDGATAGTAGRLDALETNATGPRTSVWATSGPRPPTPMRGARTTKPRRSGAFPERARQDSNL
jgi:hypothetical protein